MKKFNESLLKKSLLAIVIIALSVPATFFLSYNLIKAHAKNAALKDMAVIAESYKGQVCQFLEMTRRRAQDFASDGFMRTRLPKELHRREGSVNNLSKYLAENKFTLDESIKTIHVLSMEGRVVASTDNSEIGKDLSNETFFIKGKDAIALAGNPAGHDGLPELAVSAPIFSMGKKRAIGVLVNTIRLSELNKILSGEYRIEQHSILWNKGRWKSIEVYLVNRDRRMITNSIFVKDAVLKQIVNTLPVVTGLTMKKEMAGFYKDYRGIVVAGASKPIPQLEWVLLTEIDENEILSFTRLMLMSAPIPAGIIIIVGIVLFITFFRRVVKPLHQISDSIKSISCGNYNTSMPVLAHDEIGMLCEAFNNMARDIKASTALLKKNEFRLAEAQRVAHLGHWVWDIVKNELYWSDEMYRIFDLSSQELNITNETFLQCVHPDDRDFVKKSVDDALYERKRFDIEYRILLKDTTVRIVHALAEIAFDETGKQPIQMLGTVQDITEYKRMEEDVNLLQTIVLSISVAHNLRDALIFVMQKICHITNWVYGEAWIPNTSGTLLERYDAFYSSIDGLKKFNTLTKEITFPMGIGLPGRVWAAKQSIWVRDITQNPDYLCTTIANEFGLKTGIAFPIIADNDVVAVMLFYKREATEKDEHLISIVSSLLTQLGSVVKSKKAEITLKEQSSLMALGADIGVALIQRGTLREILQRCAEALVKNLNAKFARIWTLNKEANVLELQSSAGIYTYVDGQYSRIPVGMFKVGLIAEERKPILTNSVIGDFHIHEQEWEKQTGMVSFAGYPLIVEDRLVGVVEMFAQKPLTEITLKALASVSDSIALGIVRKRGEENLLTIKNRLEFLFKVSPVMTYSAKYDDYSVTFMSENVSLQLGYCAQEFIDNPRFWIDRVHPEDLPHILDKLSHLAEVNTMALEYRFLHKNGTYRSMYDELILVRDTVGNPVETIGYWLDVTEKKRMEEEQNTLREHLYHLQKLESVGTLAGGIAHDFNNILSIIIGYGNLLEKSLGKGIPSRIHIQKILKSAERATNLVQGLLAFSRKQGSCQKPAPINRILLPVNNLLSRLIGEDIVLDIVPAKKDCIVMADSGQMEQVLINLATNARDAMPNGGKLTIQADIVELGSEFIRTHGYGEIGEYARISVTDTGMGMDKETQQRIFEPFFTTKEVGKGTGLGLSIVYGIIKQHGGYINVESKPGKGAAFRIYLPLIKSTVEEGKPTSLPAYLNGTEMILLAEDEEDVRNLTKSLLEEADYKVIAAIDGYDTINKFMENKDNINLLLLDVIMPTKNGRETYEEIRKIRPDIKALFMSGYSESVIHKIIVLKEGLNYISKPFSQTALLKKVREILDNSVVSI